MGTEKGREIDRGGEKIGEQKREVGKEGEMRGIRR